MKNIDWEAIHNLLPIYAYEYDRDSDFYRERKVEYFYPFEKENHGKPVPEGWSQIVRETAHPEDWREAADQWVREVLRPDEKAVWLDTATGDFSNTFRLGDLLNSTLNALDHSKIGGKELAEKTGAWKLIVYRCEYGSEFEFSNLMRVVTKPREDR